MFGSHKETFLSELGWREFSYHLLYHFPKINKQNLKEQFNKLDWNVNQGKKLINFNYDKFTFEYSYKNINKNKELDENKTLYEKISIVDSNKSYENLYPALSNF